jgi:hypothetical protein
MSVAAPVSGEARLAELREHVQQVDSIGDSVAIGVSLSVHLKRFQYGQHVGNVDVAVAVEVTRARGQRLGGGRGEDSKDSGGAHHRDAPFEVVCTR